LVGFIGGIIARGWLSSEKYLECPKEKIGALCEIVMIEPQFAALNVKMPLFLFPGLLMAINDLRANEYFVGSLKMWVLHRLCLTTTPAQKALVLCARRNNEN